MAEISEVFIIYRQMDERMGGKLETAGWYRTKAEAEAALEQLEKDKRYYDYPPEYSLDHRAIENDEW